MPYIENPKFRGSGIVGAIPQVGKCPINCSDCFYQSGRSYLEPLDKNLPNMPSMAEVENRVVRVNDGNDSNNEQAKVIDMCKVYPMKFYNTSIYRDLEKFDAPVVLTVNPGKMTDKSWHEVNPVPNNLMFVRFRTNSWNTKLLKEVVDYYSSCGILTVPTFMAYYEGDIPEQYRSDYVWQTRLVNEYWVVTRSVKDRILEPYKGNVWVHACGESLETCTCRFCGICLREYFATMEKMRKE